MVLFIILGVIILVTLGVLGFLFYMLSKEGEKKENEKAVPLTDLAQLKKELSSGMIDLPKAQPSENETETIPLFEEPKVSLPTQDVVSLAEDDEYKKRAQELEDELAEISQRAERQLDGAKHLIETLTEENEALKNQQARMEEAQQKLNELEGETSNLKTENINLQSQLETTTAQVRLLEEQMTAVKLQMGEEISRANATVSELNREKEALVSAPRAEPATDQAVLQELETLRAEQIQLKQKNEEIGHKYEELVKKQEKLEKDNEQLQYEMVKARAQSSGLERVSLNYKNQLEDFLKKVSLAEASNDHLSQAKNRLEGMVEEIKLQNEELIKKDQLNQFELEKNRSRLLTIEREYEDLKARVQQKDSQV